MTDYIRLPRSLLESIPSALHRGILVSLLERADENGLLAISVRSFADEIKVSYQTLRTALSRLSANAIINATATQRLTQITICNFSSYTTSPRKPQRNSNATANAITTQSKPTKFTPPTREEAQAYIDEMGFHWGDADLFLDFNKQKDWRLSDGKPMRDWKAAMRNWENRWKQKYGKGQNNTPSGDKYAARRGTDVNGSTEADYHTAF